MPFTIPYGSPIPYAAQQIYTPNGRLVDLIRAQGQDAARIEELKGQQQAALWGGVGQTIHNTAGAAIQAHQQAPIDAINRQKAADVAHLAEGKKALAGALEPVSPQGPGLTLEESQPVSMYLKKEGDVSVWDIPKLTSFLAAKGFGDNASELLNGAEHMNASHRAESQAALIYAQSQADAMASAAAQADKLMELGVGFGDAIDIVSTPAIADKKIQPEQIARLKSQSMNLTPAQQRGYLQTLMSKGSKAPIKLGKDEELIDPYNPTGPPIATNKVNEKPTEATISMDAADPASPTRAQSQAALALLKPQTSKGRQAEWGMLDGKQVAIAFDPDNGKRYDSAGNDVTARVKPIPPASVTVNAGQEGDAKSIADAIISGDQPPDVKGLFRLAGPVRAELARQGYDMTTANLDWEATKKHLSTLNGAQQTRLRQAIVTASDSLTVIEDLANKWDAGRLPLLNKISLTAAKNGAYGKEAASIATQLEGQITDVTSELGNVYMGGNSPTDHALQLAGKNLSANWDKKVLLDMVGLARKNLQIRNNSIASSGAILSGGATPTAPAAPAVGSTYKLVNGKWVKQ